MADHDNGKFFRIWMTLDDVYQFEASEIDGKTNPTKQIDLIQAKEDR